MLTYAIVLVQNYLAALKNEEGQGMAEYGLILALVAIAAIVVLGTMGDQLVIKFQEVVTALGGA